MRAPPSSTASTGGSSACRPCATSGRANWPKSNKTKTRSTAANGPMRAFRTTRAQITPRRLGINPQTLPDTVALIETFPRGRVLVSYIDRLPSIENHAGPASSNPFLTAWTVLGRGRISYSELMSSS